MVVDRYLNCENKTARDRVAQVTAVILVGDQQPWTSCRTEVWTGAGWAECGSGISCPKCEHKLNV